MPLTATVRPSRRRSVRSRDGPRRFDAVHWRCMRPDDDRPSYGIHGRAGHLSWLSAADGWPAPALRCGHLRGLLVERQTSVVEAGRPPLAKLVSGRLLDRSSPPLRTPLAGGVLRKCGAVCPRLDDACAIPARCRRKHAGGWHDLVSLKRGRVMTAGRVFRAASTPIRSPNQPYGLHLDHSSSHSARIHVVFGADASSRRVPSRSMMVE